MLGLFENPFTDESLSKKVVHSKEHVDTARKVAEKAICLLKNQNGLLPLKKDIGKIAVHPAHVYVAVRQAVAHKAWKQLQGGKIKGKTCRVRLLK